MVCEVTLGNQWDWKMNFLLGAKGHVLKGAMLVSRSVCGVSRGHDEFPYPKKMHLLFRQIINRITIHLHCFPPYA